MERERQHTPIFSGLGITEVPRPGGDIDIFTGHTCPQYPAEESMTGPDMTAVGSDNVSLEVVEVFEVRHRWIVVGHPLIDLAQGEDTSCLRDAEHLANGMAR